MFCNRPVLLGYYLVNGEWVTIDGGSPSYQAEIAGEGDYVTLQTDGTWERLTIDPNDLVGPGVLCSVGELVGVTH